MDKGINELKQDLEKVEKVYDKPRDACDMAYGKAMEASRKADSMVRKAYEAYKKTEKVYGRVCEAKKKADMARNKAWDDYWNARRACEKACEALGRTRKKALDAHLLTN